MMPDTRCLMPDKDMKKTKSIKDLDIFVLAKNLAVAVHRMTLDELPKHEMYETGSQIRRCAKSIVSNIVEGFGRRIYKNEFIKFLTYAVASCDETKVHIEILYETGSLSEGTFREMLMGYDELCAKLFKFREAVMKKHRVP